MFDLLRTGCGKGIPIPRNGDFKALVFLKGGSSRIFVIIALEGDKVLLRSIGGYNGDKACGVCGLLLVFKSSIVDNDALFNLNEDPLVLLRPLLTGVSSVGVSGFLDTDLDWTKDGDGDVGRRTVVEGADLLLIDNDLCWFCCLLLVEGLVLREPSIFNNSS